MFEPRQDSHRHQDARRWARVLGAAGLEPTLIVAVYLAVAAWFDAPIGRPGLTLCVLVFALRFPGRAHFDERPLPAARQIATDWAGLLLILALCGGVTGSLGLFEPAVLLGWGVLTPAALFLALLGGRRVVRWNAALPENRRRAIVIGAGAHGVTVGAALQARARAGLDFAGYFDDRADERVHPDALPERLGGQREAATYVRANGIDEVYLTLPLGSQPRIAALLDQLQEGPAALYYVPDAFGLRLLQGRLQDLHGLRVVGLRAGPQSGIDALVERFGRWTGRG